jgi:hypothetical protein
MCREIGIAQIAADALEIGVDRVRDLAFVVNVASAFGDQSQRVSEIGVAENFAFSRRMPIDEIGGARIVELLDQILVLLERGHIAFPVERDELRDGKAVLRIADGRREIVRHRQLAEFVMQREPRIDRAGHGDGQRTHGRNMRRGGLPAFFHAASTSACILARSRPIAARPEPL